jgi:hypothetical protein
MTIGIQNAEKHQSKITNTMELKVQKITNNEKK